LRRVEWWVRQWRPTAAPAGDGRPAQGRLPLSLWRHYRRGSGLHGEFERSTFFGIDGQEEAERERPGGAPAGPRKHNASTVTGSNVDLLA